MTDLHERPPAPRIFLIAASTRNRIIDRDNRMPWRLPEHLRRFKRLTLGRTVTMARKTCESIQR